MVVVAALAELVRCPTPFDQLKICELLIFGRDYYCDVGVRSLAAVSSLFVCMHFLFQFLPSFRLARCILNFTSSNVTTPLEGWSLQV
jgi:hypothetical protein